MLSEQFDDVVELYKRYFICDQCLMYELIHGCLRPVLVGKFDWYI